VNDPELADHFASFEGVWHGGFYAGDPLDPSQSSWGLFGYLPVPYAIVLACIRPYVDADTAVLEIGPGRGAYTRALTPAKEVWCVDALSAEHNKFWEYVGRLPSVHYLHVSDFSLDGVPDGSIDFVFSYDALCHVPFSGIESYAQSLHAKLRPGSQCFWMVADYAKYRRFIAEPRSVARELTSQVGRPWLRQLIERVARRVEDRQLEKYRAHIDAPQGPEGSWWYDAGTTRTVEMLQDHGYRVVNPDVGVDPRSPVIHFARP
jgi:hypothetical protein